MKLIDGLHLLTTHYYYKPTMQYLVVGFALLFIVVLLASIICNDLSAGLLFGGTYIIIFFIISVLISAMGVKKITYMYEAEYEVLIDDDVNFNDFNSKYEVLSQDGEIYTIGVKE